MKEDIVVDAMNGAFRERSPLEPALRRAIGIADRAGDVRALSRLLRMVSPIFADRFHRLRRLEVLRQQC